MAKRPAAASKRVSDISDDAVRAKTGKTWAQWLKLLDAAGAKKMTHREIVAHVSGEYAVGPWWRQMVAVGYEQARGMREVHQTRQGYSISVSRTMAASANSLFEAWQDEKTRGRWLADKPIVIRKAAPGKSMRITWTDGETSVEVNFYPKGEAKTQVAVQHSKLKDVKAAARMKTYWASALDRLKEMLEG